MTVAANPIPVNPESAVGWTGIVREREQTRAYRDGFESHFDGAARFNKRVLKGDPMPGSLWSQSKERMAQ
jgi:hypothetical protein